MSIGLDNPGLLPFAALVGLPILIHFIARPRPRLLKFPSLMLLEKAHRESVRLRRPHHWLLLILRTLWVALLIAVFLQPRWFLQERSAAVSGSKTLIVVIDASASLRAREGTQSRYAVAVSEAVSLLRQLNPGDRANVIRARAVPESIYSEPGLNRDYLIEELRKRPGSREGGSLQEALRMAVDQLSVLEGEREIVVISDFQPRPNGTPVVLFTPRDIRLHTLNVAGETVPNQAVTHLQVHPARPVSGQPFELEVEIHNFSPEPIRRQLSLRIGDRHEQSTVMLPANGSTRSVFEFELSGDEALSATAELEEDAFPDDDARHVIIPIRPGLRAGVWGRDDTARIWTLTLQALPGVDPVPFQDLDLIPPDLDLLLLSGWRGERLAEIVSFVESGNSLFFRPAEITAPLGDWLDIPTGSPSLSRLDPPMGLRVAEPWPEILALFEDGSFGSPDRALLSQHAHYPIPDSVLSPILLLENGETVWGQFSNLPRVFYWNISLSPAHGDVVTHAEWVPTFGEAIRHAFRSSEPLSDAAGSRLPLDLENREADSVRLQSFTEEDLPLRVGDGVVASAEPLPPGLYLWTERSSDAILEQRAVNLPPEESDLRSLPPETLEGDPLPELTHADEWTLTREGRPLWPWLLALAFLIAAVEHLLTHRELRA